MTQAGENYQVEVKDLELLEERRRAKEALVVMEKQKEEYRARLAYKDDEMWRKTTDFDKHAARQKCKLEESRSESKDRLRKLIRTEKDLSNMSHQVEQLSRENSELRAMFPAGSV